MDRDAFWQLIDELGPDLDLDSLLAALTTLTGTEISSFWDHLVTCIGALNTEQHRDQTPLDVADDPQHPLPLSDDAFLDARLAVVAHGWKAYEAVLSEPKRFTATWPFELGAGVWSRPSARPTRRQPVSRGRR